MATEKAPVSLRALIGRINRKLKPQDQVMKRKRGNWREAPDYSWRQGEYYVVDTARNMVVEPSEDPLALARKLGCLAEWEELVDA